MASAISFDTFRVFMLKLTKPVNTFEIRNKNKPTNFESSIVKIEKMKLLTRLSSVLFTSRFLILFKRVQRTDTNKDVHKYRASINVENIIFKWKESFFSISFRIIKDN